MEDTYILSSKFRLLDYSEIFRKKLPEDTSVEKLRKKELFVLQDDHTWHLINPEINAFIGAFKEKNSIDNVLQIMADQASCEKDLIKPTLYRFFDKLKGLGILELDKSESKPLKRKQECAFRKGETYLNYTILSRIFHRGNIEIYKAINSKTQNIVVLKILNTKNAIEEKKKKQLLKLFRQEYKIIKTVQGHPNIYKILKYSENESLAILILEYIDFGGIRRYLRNHRLNLKRRIKLILQLTSAISWVHRKGITHGDIHLSNIMISKPNLLKLIDFNMSNHLSIQKNEVVRKGGVYQYIPPEKINNKPFQLVRDKADYVSEVYQIGVIIYFILYQKMPFDAFLWSDLSNKIINDIPLFNENTWTGQKIPVDLIRMVKKSLSKDPKHRYKSGVHLNRAMNRNIKI